jgi:succinylarginine dihydrolase
MDAQSSQKASEVNFDGIVGPTHFYGGYAYGNIASMEHERQPSNPKQAALQGLEKMKLLCDLGIKQAVFPPQERPEIHLFRKLGFTGTDNEILSAASKDSPALFFQACSSSSMWAANAATVCPSIDSQDNRVHLTAANLSSHFHRAIEASTTFHVLKAIFSGEDRFEIHPPLPFESHFCDEGAANHTRLCLAHHLPGIHLFTYGRKTLENDSINRKFPARQSLEASQAISRLHLIPQDRLLFAQQNSAAIEGGVFHNDVISVGNESLFLYHEDAFCNTPKIIDKLQQLFYQLTNQSLCCIKISNNELTLKEAVQSYLFNSQIVTLPDQTMSLIAPIECLSNPRARALLESLASDPNLPISTVHYVDLRQSMQNGGGPACLRLRIVLTPEELQKTNPQIFLTDSLYLKLKNWIDKHYHDRLCQQDLLDPSFLIANQIALDELTQLLNLGSLYSFQR